MDARKLRGAAPRTFAERLNEYRAIAMPLMVKVMRGSIAVSLVMDSRAFGAYKTRTWLISIKMTARDYIALFAGLVFYVASIIADRFTEGLFFGA
jgi:energy-coupling factor transporter transmembrane protein EcfT